MSLLDLVQQQLGQGGIQDIGQKLGTDPSTTQRAIAAALPMMLGGMASTAQQPGGESALQVAMGALDGGGSAGTGGQGALGGVLGGAGLGGILGNILGEHHATVQDGVQRASGLDAGKAGKLLMLLAPFIIRALAKHQASAAGQQDGGLAGGLEQAANHAAQSAGAPGIGGILGSILGRS